MRSTATCDVIADEWYVADLGQPQKALQIRVDQWLNGVPMHQGQIHIRRVLAVLKERCGDRPTVCWLESLQGTGDLQSNMGRWITQSKFTQSRKDTRCWL